MCTVRERNSEIANTVLDLLNTSCPNITILFLIGGLIISTSISEEYSRHVICHGEWNRLPTCSVVMFTKKTDKYLTMVDFA